MSERATPETDNDTQFELAAWELLKESRQELTDYKAHAEKVRETISKVLLNSVEERDKLLVLARELLDALENCREDSVELLSEWDWKRGAGTRNHAKYEEIEGRISVADSVIDKAKEVLP